MKKITTISTIFLLALLTSCDNRNNQPTGDIITINVTANFPHRALILQDFMNVEYIILEDADDFLTQGVVLDVGNEIIIVRNNIRDGNMYLFDRNGAALRVINRMGQGPGEYSNLGAVVLDEENGEIFVIDSQRILVYDLYGNYSRSFPIQAGWNFPSFRNFDSEHLIGRGASMSADVNFPFAIISKKDGSVVNEIPIYFEQGIEPMVSGEGIMLFLHSVIPSTITPYQNGFILTEIASDTLFKISPDSGKEPFIVRTPPIHSMGVKEFLLPIFFTDRYYFMEIARKEIRQVPGFFPRTQLVYDREQGAVFRYTLYNGDFYPKMEINPAFISAINSEIVFRKRLEAYQLIEANERGELRGRLQEVAEKLHEDSNPVIMLVRH